MSADDDGDSYPRSMRHRQVLDVAEEHPDASIDEIASMVPSATADLVEHVFEEHGDPAADESAEAEPEETDEENEDAPPESDPTGDGSVESADESGVDTAEAAGESSETNDGDLPDVTLEELTERQRELLEVVAARPEATQGEIADHFDVTRATVSRWASDIEGFEWRDRAEVVAQAFETPSTAVSTDGGPTTTTATGGNQSDATDGAFADIEDRLDRLESRLDALESTDVDGVDVELAHKIAHACLRSEAISEDEELRIFEWLLK